MAATTNRHPVDELADIRAQISHLEGRADYLRRTILAGGCSLRGDDHHAIIKRVSRQTIDTKAIRKEFGDATLQPFMRQSTTDQVFIREGQATEAPGPADHDDGEF